jgi:hypothetical protein
VTAHGTVDGLRLPALREGLSKEAGGERRRGFLGAQPKYGGEGPCWLACSGKRLAEVADGGRHVFGPLIHLTTRSFAEAEMRPN